MTTVTMDKKDEIVMKLVHFLVTKEDYTPIVVNGVKNEVWLENTNGPYKIIRINSNYIHNKEQYNFDLFKTNNVAMQIKKKTVSFNMSVLNIFLDINDDVKLSNREYIDNIKVGSTNELIHNKLVVNAFPNIENDIINTKNNLDLIVNVTNDINKKTAKENKRYEEVFKPKKIVVTYILMALCIITYFFELVNPDIIYMGANYRLGLQNGEVYRLITGMFLHGSIWHLICNMYSLYIIGKQAENYLGKTKFLIVYLISGIVGGLFSCALSTSYSVGASGAIFGLLGSLLYFGYYYRLYLGEALRHDIIPVILINLAVGLIIPGIDLASHIGGLVAGVFTTMALGIKNKSDKKDSINGIIVLTILIAFLIYMIFFR